MKRVIVGILALTLCAPLSLYSQGTGARCTTLPSGDAACDMRRVLVIAAHPDDEDSQLISWLARGGNAETAYLSLTRGDGGQNLIGNELGEQLGVIRTEELLAARRVDGAHQYFTRAYDFGFSKNADETFKHWPKDSLLNDVVKVVRAFRPQVILAIFSGTPRDGHGQHQVSAILAKEAFEISGDTVRFPVKQFGHAWTASKFYRDAWFVPGGGTLKINVGEYNPELGKSYAEIAGESRSQHKSQGFGSLQRKGVVWASVMRDSTRVNASTPANQEKSMFDGIQAWAPKDHPELRESAGLDNAVALEAIADRRAVTLGDSARVTATIYNRSRQNISVNGSTVVAPDSAYSWTFWYHGTEITQPWWLVTPRNGDLFSPPISTLSEDQRDRAKWLSVTYTTGSRNVTYTKTTPVVYRYVDPVHGDTQRPIAVAPAISVTFDNATELARAGAPIERFYNVTLRSSLMHPAPVSVKLNLPAGLTADSISRTVTLDSAGTRTVTFKVHGKLAAGSHAVSAVASTGGIQSSTGYIPIEYEHISPERMYRPAQVAIHAIDIAVPSRLNVGYIQGVGDNVAAALEQLGIPVTTVDPQRIPTVDLSKFSTVVVGSRAYQANRDLIDNNSYLLNYARNGGTLVVQYGQYEMTRAGIMPYPIALSRPAERVTVETAPVTIIDPASTVMRSPNAITQADFSGWLQDLSLYMPTRFDEHYQPIVSLNDPGENPNRGGILITPYGKGLYVYTTLAFFRQLPAGLSGATRLFVNLLSMTNGSTVPRSTTGR